jgi:hypothetical protein
VGGSGVSVGQADVGAGCVGVPVGASDVTVGVSVGHGCAPAEIIGHAIITNKATVIEITALSKRITNLPYFQTR